MCDHNLIYSLKFRPNGFIVVIDLFRKNLRVHSANVAILFHDWVLVEPNNFADIRQLAEERSESLQLFPIKLMVVFFRR